MSSAEPGRATGHAAQVKACFTAVSKSISKPGSRKTATTTTTVSLDPRALREELHEAGLELVQDLDGPELVRFYDSAGINRLESTSASHIAVARVG